jgi:hypothetical protein
VQVGQQAEAAPRGCLGRARCAGGRARRAPPPCSASRTARAVRRARRTRRRASHSRSRPGGEARAGRDADANGADAAAGRAGPGEPTPQPPEPVSPSPRTHGTRLARRPAHRRGGFEAVRAGADRRRRAVVRVAPHRMGASRRGSASRASRMRSTLAIARPVVKDGAERFPVAYLDEAAMEIRLLSDHRKDTAAERTRVQNRLRWHLLELCRELERSLQRGARRFALARAGRSMLASAARLRARPVRARANNPAPR